MRPTSKAKRGLRSWRNGSSTGASVGNHLAGKFNLWLVWVEKSGGNSEMYRSVVFFASYAGLESISLLSWRVRADLPFKVIEERKMDDSCHVCVGFLQ